MAGDDSLKDKYEFLDHTADVQIHAWGLNLKETFENAAIAMTAYITDINTIQTTTKETIDVRANDLNGLLFRFLDEVLFLFNAEPFLLSKKVRITSMNTDTSYAIQAECFGEPFSLEKHPQGTEIKAITYSAMKIVETEGQCDIYFIVDI